MLFVTLVLQVEARVAVSHIDSATFLYDLPQFAPTFFRSPLVARREPKIVTLEAEN